MRPLSSLPNYKSLSNAMDNHLDFGTQAAKGALVASALLALLLNSTLANASGNSSSSLQGSDQLRAQTVTVKESAVPLNTTMPISVITNAPQSNIDEIPEFDGADDFIDDEPDQVTLTPPKKTIPPNNSWVDNGEQSVSNPALSAPNDTKSNSASLNNATLNAATPNNSNLSTPTAKLPALSEPVSQVPLNAISPTTLKTFVEVIDLVRREYVEPVSDEVLFNDAMSGMLTKLDSHAEFLDAEAFENLRAFTQGDVGEIGLQAKFQPSLGYWVVTNVIAGSPAANERIKVGDYIHQINEIKLTDTKTANDIEQMLSGIAGTQVELVVSSAGRRKRTVTLQRNQRREQEVRIRLQDGVAIINLPVFQNTSRQKLLTALAGLDAPVSGIIMDIRDNPGGVLESAVDIAGLFMADTEVVRVKGRRGVSKTLKTAPEAILATVPMIILQNRYSASAAEVLASSLQVAKRAQVVGETSYGKGSVQSVIPINDEQAIKLTVAYYLTADGRTIDDIGVDPDTRLQGEESTWEWQALTLMQDKKLPEGIRFVLNQPAP
ncbi:MAG: S41 family peptidase [Psychrobacter sp.]|nr:S41 family peptidase [Psychrobacter sp.]